MLRSLFAGISGLRVNQVMLDVTGNNIANANTVGFKSSSTVFSDTLSQMLTSASGPNTAAGRGGSNPIQVGLGVQLASTNTNFNQGSNQTTGGLTDLMIQGDGMFVVKKGEEEVYTRAGAFSFDEDANLVAPGGGLRPGLHDVRRRRQPHRSHRPDQARPPDDGAGRRPEGLRDRRRRQDHRDVRRRQPQGHRAGRDRGLHEPEGTREGRQHQLPRHLQLRRRPVRRRRGRAAAARSSPVPSRCRTSTLPRSSPT